MKRIAPFLRRRAATVAFCGVVLGASFLHWMDWLWSVGLTVLGASTSPAFGSVPFSNGSPGALTAANTALDGTGTTLLLLTAPAAGAYCERVRVEHLGSNVATVARVFRNNGSTPSVAANNSLIATKTIAANTLSQTAESIAYDIWVYAPLKSGERIYVSIGTAVAAGLQFTPYGGDLG